MIKFLWIYIWWLVGAFRFQKGECLLDSVLAMILWIIQAGHWCLDWVSFIFDSVWLSCFLKVLPLHPLFQRELPSRVISHHFINNIHWQWCRIYATKLIFSKAYNYKNTHLILYITRNWDWEQNFLLQIKPHRLRTVGYIGRFSCWVIFHWPH